MAKRGEKIAIARDAMQPAPWSQRLLAKQLAARGALGLSEEKWKARIANYEAERLKNDVPDHIMRAIADVTTIELPWFDEDGDAKQNPPRFKRPALAVRESIISPLLGSLKFPVGYAPVEMPLAGEVPASSDWGDPLASEDKVEMDAKYAGPGRFVARVKGASCFPALFPRDLTVWEQNTDPPRGSIVIAERLTDHACTVKQYLYDAVQGKNILKPINPEAEVPDDEDGWTILAFLTDVIRLHEDGFEQTWSNRRGLRPRQLIDTLNQG